MILKPNKEIVKKDFEDLVSNKIVESKTLEYKMELKISSDSEKKEFLADISAIANTQGGQIIFGIKEEKGIPSELVGIYSDNIDNMIQTIENLLRDGIEPRISSIEICNPTELDANRFAVLIKIPKSWNSPHRVTLKAHNRFYGRNSNGKYELEVSELRLAFNLSESLSEKLKKFRADAILKIQNNEMPKLNSYKEKLVIHLIPMNAFQSGHQIDLGIINSEKSLIAPFAAQAWDYHFNFDGYVSFFDYHLNENISYTQFYKNGIIEIVAGHIAHETNNTKAIYGKELTTHTINILKNCFELYEKLNINYPLFLCVSILNSKDVLLVWDSGQLYPHNKKNAIDRNLMNVPEILLEEKPNDLASTLKPIFTSIWNSAKMEKCPLYQ